MKSWPLCFFTALLLTFVAMATPAPLGRIQTIKDQFLPGPELRPRAGNGREPVVLRITAVYPQGTAGFRYDFTWSALETGSYDLTTFLEPANGAAPVKLPAVTVEAAGVLPAGPPPPLPDLASPRLPPIGGYRFWLPAGIVLWVLGGAAFFYYTRKRRVAAAQTTGPAAQTLAQRMEPLLQRALSGPLATSEKAELERLVIAYGQEHLGISGLDSGMVWKKLRENASTGLWLKTLEDWLHRPSPIPPTEAELKTLLTRITAAPAS